MNLLLIYLYKASLVLTLLYGIYWIFLRKETFFSLNRFYLITAGFLALAMPFFHFDLFPYAVANPLILYLDPLLITPQQFKNMDSGSINLLEITGMIYLIGASFFFGKFIFQVLQLMRLSKYYRTIRQKGLNIIFVEKPFSSFSFFNFIFLPVHQSNNEADVILKHELVHVQQFHSADLIFIEFLRIILWFNPFAWLTGKSLKTIHEFLADDGVLRSGCERDAYQHLLLNHIPGFHQSSLSNNFNFSLLKNRIVMMTKSRSKAIAKGKVLFALPVLISLVFLFSTGTFSQLNAQDKNKEADKTSGAAVKSTGTNTQDQQAKTKSSVTNEKKEGKEETIVLDKQPAYPGGHEALVKFIIENVKYPPEAKKNGTEGKVFVSFLIKADGSITDVTVTKGIGSGCDEEAVRVIKLMPKWIPGELNGKKVDVKTALPIQFKLDKDQKKQEEPKK